MVLDMDAFHINALAHSQVQAAHVAQLQAKTDGHWLAALIANNPRIARKFSDHEAIAKKLEEAGECDALASVASSGVLDSQASREYRAAFTRLVA